MVSALKPIDLLTLICEIVNHTNYSLDKMFAKCTFYSKFMDVATCQLHKESIPSRNSRTIMRNISRNSISSSSYGQVQLYLSGKHRVFEYQI